MTVELDVVIPVRDVDMYLDEALESVFAQTGIDPTVYVVDAGSIRPIVLPPAFANRAQVRLLRSELPLMAGGARNVGVSRGSAEWITFLDADDVWALGSRRDLIDAAIASDADLAVGTLVNFREDDSHELQLPPDGQLALIAGGIVVRRSAWDTVGPFAPDLSVGEFIEWHNRARLAGIRQASIDAPVLHRRIHLRSTMAGRISDRNDYLEVVRRWIARSN